MSLDLQKYIRTPMTNTDLRVYMTNELAKIQQATDTFFKMLGDANMLLGSVEGDFLPTIVGATTPGVGTYSNQKFRFIKIGRLVIFGGRLSWAGHTGTGIMTIRGLPYVCSASIRVAHLLVSANATVASNDVALQSLGTDEIVIQQALTAGGRAMSAAGDIFLTGIYFTDT